MTEDDLHNLEMLDILERRRRVLQLQIAQQGNDASSGKVVELEDLERRIEELQGLVRTQQRNLYTLLQPRKVSQRSYWATADLKVTIGNAEFTVKMESDNIFKLKESVLAQLKEYSKDGPALFRAREAAELPIETRFSIGERASAFYAPELLLQREHRLDIESSNVNEVSTAVNLFVEGFNLGKKKRRSRKKRKS